MARKRRKARRRRHRHAVAANPVRRRRRRRANPRRRHRSHFRSHGHRTFVVNPRRRHRRGRRRNPAFGGLTKGGISWKKALPIVVIGGAVTAGALYAGGQVIMRYGASATPAGTALKAGAIATVAGVIAAAVAGPIPGILVAATLGGVAISALNIAKLPPGTGMTTGASGLSGYRAMTSRNIPQLGMVLTDNLRGYQPMGMILHDNMRGLGSLGAGPRARGRYHRDTETTKIISDLAHH